MQLLLAEVAVIAVLAVLSHGILLIACALLAGIALLVGTLARKEGRWWLERRLMARQFRHRQHDRPMPDRRDARLTALQSLAPGLVVEDVSARDGAQIGVARDDAGWYAVAAVTPTAAMRDDPSVGLPLDILVRALTDADQPGAVLQVVTHTVPAPSLDLDATRLAGRSYRDLLQEFGPVPVPVDRVIWLAVRLDAQALAEAGADRIDDAGQAPAAVATLIRRVAKALRQAGLGYQVLNADGLIGALARSCDLDQPAPTGAAPPPREEWSAWHSGTLAHRTFWLQDWPTIAQSGALLDWLATAPAALTSIAMTLAPDGDTVDLRCLARVAARAGELTEVCAAVHRGAQLAHARLFQLDGEQGPAVYASAPTGGGPR
jgi:type VII secretion protein EccE